MGKTVKKPIRFQDFGISRVGHIMRITCPNCAAQYEVDAEDISFAGQDVQCSECFTIWLQKRDGATEQVRKADALVDAEAEEVAETASSEPFEPPKAAPKAEDWSKIAEIVRDISKDTEPAPEPENNLRAMFAEEPIEDHDDHEDVAAADEPAEEDHGWDFEQHDDDEEPLSPPPVAEAALEDIAEPQAQSVDADDAIKASAILEPVEDETDNWQEPAAEVADSDVDFEDFVWKNPEAAAKPVDEEDIDASISAALAGEIFDKKPSGEKPTEIGRKPVEIVEDLNEDTLRDELRREIEAQGFDDEPPVTRGRISAEMPAGLVPPKAKAADEDALKNSLRSTKITYGDEEKEVMRPKRRYRFGFYLTVLIFGLLTAAYVFDDMITAQYPPAEPYMIQFKAIADILRGYAEIAGGYVIQYALIAWGYVMDLYNELMAPASI